MLKPTILTSLFFTTTLFAQPTDPKTVVQTLCSPAFHGRGYVNGGDSIAAEFLAQEYKNRGCEFFNNNPFQSFEFPVNTFPGRMLLEINGVALVPGRDFLVNEESCGGTLSGELLYVSTEQLMDPQAFNIIRSQTGPQSIIACNTDLLRTDSLKKAQAVISRLNQSFPVIRLTANKFTWSVASSQTPFPLFDVHPDALPTVVNGLKVHYEVDARQLNHTARNVIAYIPAKKKSSKYLVYTAHYDHLGRMGQATYFPGGNDNASGTALLLQLASHFKENPPKVNVVFMSFAGEEAGLIGSHYYVKHPIFPLNKITFLTNIDIMGSGEDGITVVNATEFPAQYEKLTAINEKENLLVKVGKRGKAANSDHYFFTEAGVPAFFIYTMGPNKNYHDIYDTYENLSFAEYNDLLKLLVNFGECVIK